MFYLMWMLFAVTGAEDLSSTVSPPSPCIRSPVTSTSAQAGLCAVFPCSANLTDRTQNVRLYKCDEPNNCSRIFSSDDSTAGLKNENRISLLKEPNCSIIVKHVKMSDSGIYQIRDGDEETCNVLADYNLTVLNQKPRLWVPVLTDGQQTTLTCTAPDFCSGIKPNITWMWRGAAETQTQIKGNLTDVVPLGLNSTLKFEVSAEHHDTNISCRIDFGGNVTTSRTQTLKVSSPRILGNTTLNKGDFLNLTCSSSFPDVSIVWTKSASNLTFEKEKQTDSRSASLIVSDVTAEHSGFYICTATQHNTSMTAQVEVKVQYEPAILKTSTCYSQRSEVMTCVCVSEGVPLPGIKWPILKERTVYSVVTDVSKSRVTSSINVAMGTPEDVTVMCVSENNVGNVSYGIAVERRPTEDYFGLGSNVLEILKKLDFYFLILIGFVLGILFSSLVMCFTLKCCRCRNKKSKSLFEDLEMNETQTALKVEAERGSIRDEWAEPAEVMEANGAVEPREAEYSDINFSLIKHRADVENREKTDTEYAEIKKEQNKIEEEVMMENASLCLDGIDETSEA